MTENSFSIDPAELLRATGHVGYSWDLVRDKIIWCGNWSAFIGTDNSDPPENAAAFSAIVLPNDHYLIFNNAGASFDRVYRILGANNELIGVQEHGTTFFENGRAIRQQGLLRRTEKKPAYSQPSASSPDRDVLTGRPNRNCMLALIEKIVSGSLETRRQSAYMVVGIDKLAFMNEAMGPKMADRFLCAIADRLSALCPTRCIVGRVSGDVFGILMPGMVRDVSALAEKILSSFHDYAVTLEQVSLHFSLSIGSVVFDRPRIDATSMMIFAEQALAEAQENGRNQHVPYADCPDRSKHNRTILEIGERVKAALKTNELLLAFQPVVDAKTGKVQFYEVLSRLVHDDGSLISACEFIPVVEQLGLAPDFDKHVLDLAIVEMEACDRLHLAVNISGLTAALPDWPDFVRSKLESRPHVAQRLIIEITENAAVLDIVKIRCLVDSLRSLGSIVALDDFGAGSTSIRHLRDLSLAIMKIDRYLLTNILESPEQQHLVRLLTSMAHGLGLRAVAEGIESEEVAVWLRNENVDMLQGFHIGQPSFEKPWMEKGGEKDRVLTKDDGATPCY